MATLTINGKTMSVGDEFYTLKTSDGVYHPVGDYTAREQIEDLSNSIEKLSGSVNELSDSIDELSDSVQYATKNEVLALFK